MLDVPKAADIEGQDREVDRSGVVDRRQLIEDVIDRVQKALSRDRENREALKGHDRIRALLKSLTPREREVLELLTSGKANKMMAQDLGLSQRTVEIHRAHVMEKMGAKSVAQLVRMVMDLEHENAPRT